MIDRMGDRSGRQHVFLATPCYGGVVTQSYMECVLALVVEAATIGLDLSLAMLGQDALITRSRNTLVARFRRTEATHLLFVDADIGFAPADVLRLVSRGRDVVGGMYPIRAATWDEVAEARVAAGEKPDTAAFRYVGEPCGPLDADGLLPARFVGTGFLMISRQAIERLVAAYPDTRCRLAHVARSDSAVGADGEGEQDIHALFECLIDPDTRTYLSEDYGFCARWRAIGGMVWLDPSLRLSHHGMGEFRGDPAVRFAMPAATGSRSAQHGFTGK